MDKKTALACIEFLRRTELKGMEVDVFIACIQQLKEIIDKSEASGPQGREELHVRASD